jgi:hypothetical protein
VTVVDSAGAPAEASIQFSGPGGTDTYQASDYTYAPKKAGDYTITASKQSYSPASETFKVNPKPLALSYYFKADKLVLNATSNGKPAANVNINIKAGNTTYSVVTDAKGMATASANATGEYTLQANSPDYSGSPVTAVKSTTTVISDMWVPVLIALVAIVFIGILAVLLISLMQRRGPGSKPAFRRSPGSRLGG